MLLAFLLEVLSQSWSLQQWWDSVPSRRPSLKHWPMPGSAMVTRLPRPWTMLKKARAKVKFNWNKVLFKKHFKYYSISSWQSDKWSVVNSQLLDWYYDMITNIIVKCLWYSVMRIMTSWSLQGSLICPSEAEWNLRIVKWVRFVIKGIIYVNKKGCLPKKKSIWREIDQTSLYPLPPLKILKYMKYDLTPSPLKKFPSKKVF